jgi:hypothetical protein
MGELKVKVKEIKMENFSVKELRNRLFVKQSSILYPNSEYTYLDDVPEQIEKLENFQTWESFSKTWDILWVGLDPRTLKWQIGRHLSPLRKVVAPVKIVFLDERTKRMQVDAEDRAIIGEIDVPFKEPLPESEEDRIISESLSGKVIIDEPDHDKAIRLIEQNMKMLQEQLAILVAVKK